jgi:hypothetical protein
MNSDERVPVLACHCCALFHNDSVAPQSGTVENRSTTTPSGPGVIWDGAITVSDSCSRPVRVDATAAGDVGAPSSPVTSAAAPDPDARAPSPRCGNEPTTTSWVPASWFSVAIVCKSTLPGAEPRPRPAAP